MNDITASPSSTAKVGSSTLTALFVLFVVVVVAASTFFQIIMQRQAFAEAQATLGMNMTSLSEAIA